MIRKYVIGSPMETDSVVVDITPSDGRIPKFKADEAGHMLTYVMDDADRIYGLGETVRGINKRGWHYVSNCSDDPNHHEDKTSLYAAHNFMVVVSAKEVFGLYVDTPGKVEFDAGYTDHSILSVILEDFDAIAYFIDGASARDVVRQFRGIIGKSYVPPKWGFGLGQSRWSYVNEDEVREVADRYDEAGIPLDSIYLDIDYMDGYKDFTVSDEAFPDFKEFVDEMKSRGIRLVPIIDAGVKIEQGYDVYEEGVAGGHFVKKEDGSLLTAAVWPGRVHFPDFLREDTRRWFGDKYKVLLDAGIEGFWNDMNEPAIFYTEDHLSEVFEKIDGYKGRNLDINGFFEFQGLIDGIPNNPEDYRLFYHEKDGLKVRHDKVHNLYGFNMTRAAGEAFERLCPDKRILMFSRSSYIGMHRYGGVWTGDNASWWSHLLLNVQQMPGLNMSGFLYSGADTGGFGADVTRDLMIRWISFSIFTPLFRNHAAMGTRRQELYALGDSGAFKKLVGLRYALIPYLYNEYLRAVRDDDVIFAPLAFDYPDDERACGVEDQLMVGRSIMIAPVYVQNARGRHVYLPEGMKMVRFRSMEDYDEEELPGGDHYLRAELGEVLTFIRPGCSLPIVTPAMRVEEIDMKTLKCLSYGGSGDYEFIE